MPELPPAERTVLLPTRIAIVEWSRAVGSMGNLADFGPCLRLFLRDGSEVDIQLSPWAAIELADALRAKVAGPPARRDRDADQG